MKWQKQRNGRGGEILPSLLRELFDYNDGKLFWKIKPWRSTVKVGDEAGGIDSDGYVKVCYHCKQLRRSRIVFAMHHGRWPRPVVDHINRIRSDDRIENLREVNHAANARNNEAAELRMKIEKAMLATTLKEVRSILQG